MLRVLVGAMIACAPGLARGDGLLDPRGVGRAGASAVSDDGGAAVARNPAALARRTTPRLRVGVTARDVDTGFRAAGSDLTVDSRAPAAAAPALGFAIGWDRVVLGAAYVELDDLSMQLPEPARDQPADDVVRLFPHRYGGTVLRLRRRVLTAGAAVRATDWLAVGVGIGAARVELAESRHLWAGFETLDGPVGSPHRDLRLSLDAADAFVPSVTAGVLVAPVAVPVELAASVTYGAKAHASGDAVLERTRSDDYPAPATARSATTVTLATPLVVRSSARYLAARWSAELAAELRFVDGDASTWSFQLAAQESEPLPPTAFETAPSLAVDRDRATVRGAVDVAVVPDFLWLTAGYAYATARAAPGRLAPVWPGLSAHTVGVGVEAFWGDVTLTVGYARSHSQATLTTAEGTGVSILNPFEAGTGPAGAGRYSRNDDHFGLSLEVAWEPADPLAQ